MGDRTADKSRPTSEVIANITDEIVEQLKAKISAQDKSRTAWAMDRQRIVKVFSAFYRGFSTRLAGWLILRGASEPDAYDVMQETMHKVYRYWHTIEHPKAWARATASKAYAERVARVEPAILTVLLGPTRAA